MEMSTFYLFFLKYCLFLSPLLHKEFELYGGYTDFPLLQFTSKLCSTRDRPLGKKGAERRVAARGIAHHPLVALVAAVVTVQVVAHLVLHMVSQCGAGLVADGIVTEGQRDWLPVGTA